jgi:hypothetical protein
LQIIFCRLRGFASNFDFDELVSQLTWHVKFELSDNVLMHIIAFANRPPMDMVQLWNVRHQPMKSRSQIVGQIVATVAGGIVAAPFSIWGFIVGGDFIGAATGGILALPGGLFGAAIVIACGAGMGWLLFAGGIFVWQALVSRGNH